MHPEEEDDDEAEAEVVSEAEVVPMRMPPLVPRKVVHAADEAVAQPSLVLPHQLVADAAAQPSLVLSHQLEADVAVAAPRTSLPFGAIGL